MYRNENLCPQKNSYTDIDSSIIHDNQKVESAQCPSTDEVVLSHNGLIF